MQEETSEAHAALPALLTPQEVAAALRVHENTVYNWAKDGTLQPVKLGKLLRFRRTDVEALLSGERSA